MSLLRMYWGFNKATKQNKNIETKNYLKTVR
jgi:hypothetical protein